jgi:hypothetical protein
MILRLIKESLEQEEAEPVDFVLARLPLDLMDLTDEILAVTKDLDSNDQRVFKDLLRALLDVRRRNIGQSIDQLRYLMEAAQQSGDLRAREYQETMSQHILTRSLLDRASKQQVERGTGFE